MFPLEIFPYASLSSSVVTTIWIGVIVIALFNLRFGWVLSGLVVPGYLVPLVIVKPLSASLIVVESIVTYFVVVFLSESLSSLSRWSSIFGRDRFYALVVSSVLVRLLFDIILIPLLGNWVILNTGYEFDYRNELQSFGLIIVALMANQYWKTGIGRGLFVLIVTVAITWFIVRFVLMEYTNFSIGNLRFLYEDLAASLLSSPKAYIILLTTAFVCSRLNLRYGWDFNGILLPSLLALQWFAPYKILTSFIEAFVIVLVSRQLLRLPWLARMNMEGARLLLLFFNVSFFYKMLLGFTLPMVWPDLKITDTYGFGYLLATLLALKMHQKDIIGRVTRVTLQASFVSIVIASLIGFSLTLVSKQTEYFASAPFFDSDKELVAQADSLQVYLDHQKVDLFGSRAFSRIAKPLATELSAFRSGIRVLRDVESIRTESDLYPAARLLGAAGYRLTWIDDRYVVLQESKEKRGWGMYVIDMSARDLLNFQVPHAVDDHWLFDASRELFARLDAHTLAIGGSPRAANNDGSSDMRIEPGTIFHTFHMAFARDNVVQLMALNRNTTDGENSVVRITDRVPKALDFNRLRAVVGPFTAKWNQLYDDNIHKQTSREGFVELLLTQEARESIVLAASSSADRTSYQVRRENYRQIVSEQQGAYKALAPKPVEPLSQAQLLYFDDHILTPMLAFTKSSSSAVVEGGLQGSWSEQDDVVRDLRLLSWAASAVDYQVTLIQPHSDEEPYHLMLHDVRNDKRRWGLVLMRVEEKQEFIVHATHSAVEYGTLDYALDLFAGVDASVLTLSPGVRRNQLTRKIDTSAPLARLAGQVVMRENHDDAMLVIVPRAYGVMGKAQLPETDALIGVAGGEIRTQQLRTPQLDRVVQVLTDKGLSVGFVDGSLATSAYQPTWLPEAAYLDATVNKELAAVWLSPQSRLDYRTSTTVSGFARAFAALGLPTSEASLANRLQRGGVNSASAQIGDPALVDALRRYQSSRDIVALRALVLRWPHIVFEHVKDTRTQQDFLLAANDSGRTLAIARLTNSGAQEPHIVSDMTDPDVLTALSDPDTSVIISGED